MNYLRHPVIGRLSNTFILCGLADGASQLFLSSPSRVDPERSVRFALSGSLSVVPVWFGWNLLLANQESVLRRIMLEALLFGPLYLSSLLCWSGTIATRSPVEGFRVVKQSALSLYWDALKVVPLYNALVWFVVAPHMRGYALSGCQFFWNIYVSWFVDNALGRKSAPPLLSEDLPRLANRS